MFGPALALTLWELIRTLSAPIRRRGREPAAIPSTAP
jgi:hypothetical protein